MRMVALHMPIVPSIQPKKGMMSQSTFKKNDQVAGRKSWVGS